MSPEADPDAPLQVFLSYSRRDSAVVDELHRGLEATGLRVLRDVDDILPAEEWRARLEQLITGADGVVFVLSPASIASEVCAWEVARAVGLGKRVVPILAEEVDASAVPAALSAKNWVLLGEGVDAAVSSLSAALRTDVRWVREHTRLTELAEQWSSRGEAKDVLLRGSELAHAEDWLAARPGDAPEVPTRLHQFIARGRARANRLRAQLTIGAVVVAVVAAGLSVFAELSRRSAVASEGRAVAATGEAQAATSRAEQATREAQEQESVALARLSAALRERGEARDAIAQAVQATATTEPNPPPPEAEEALYRAVFADRLLHSKGIADVGPIRFRRTGGSWVLGVHGAKGTLFLDRDFNIVARRAPETPRWTTGERAPSCRGEPGGGSDRAELRGEWYDSLFLVHPGDLSSYSVRLVDYITRQGYVGDFAQNAAFSPECDALLLSGSHDAVDWEQPSLFSVSYGVYTGRLLGKLGGHSEPVTHVAAGPDGHFATLDEGGSVRLWALNPPPRAGLGSVPGAASLGRTGPPPREESAAVVGLDKITAVDRAPDGTVLAAGGRYGEVALVTQPGNVAEIVYRGDAEVQAVDWTDGVLRIVTEQGLGMVDAGKATWTDLPPAFDDCWEVVIDGRLGTLHCAGGEGIPAIHRLDAVDAPPLELFPEAVRASEGIGGARLVVDPHPDCRRALVTFAGNNVDLPYEGGAAYVDIENWRVIAPAPSNRPLPAFCDLAGLIEYSTQVH